ncbi:hypothetical protein LXL04_019174 [Taraxacum kok-saghyz]
MMHPEVLQSYFQEDLDQSQIYGLKYACEDHDFYSSITTPEDSSVITSDSHFHAISPCNFGVLPDLADEMQVVFPIENIAQHMEGIEGISGTELEDVLRWWGESEEMDYNSQEISMDLSFMLPPDEMEVDGQTSLCHLLKAYAEAMEMGQTELAKVILTCMNEKASPVGGTMERVAFNLSNSENQNDYINHESLKNYKSAFRAFYEIFPYGRFSHFSANSAILDAIMSDSGKVHIVDFDIGEGVQWPSMIESLAKLKKETKLTSIRRYEQSYNFEDTKNQLLDYARTCGLKLEIQEIDIEDLVREIEGSKDHECLAFNCMVGLPHMGRARDRSEVKVFVWVAKQLLLTNKGIITFVDGEDLEKMKHGGGYSSFFNENLIHYEALCDSMEENFPENLTEARIAMESLFVAPYVSSLSWHQKWEEVREDLELNEKHGLIGWRLRKETLMEGKEMVREGQSSYTVKVEGAYENEMVLEWRGTPLSWFAGSKVVLREVTTKAIFISHLSKKMPPSHTNHDYTGLRKTILPTFQLLSNQWTQSTVYSSPTSKKLPRKEEKMMQSEEIQSFLEHDLDRAGLYAMTMASSPFCSSITSLEDCSMICSDSYFQTISYSNFSTLSNLDDDIQVLVPIEGISGHELEDVLGWWRESEEMDNIFSKDFMVNEGVCSSPFMKSSDDIKMVLPLDDDMEVEGEKSLYHLLNAYGEAMEMGQRDLANVITECINEKASPLGGTMERVAFNLFHSGTQCDYIKHESMKNFKSAFEAFYEIFPYGRFSHFAANSAILEAIMSSDSQKVHIIDFDIGEGVQWPSLLEAIGKLRIDTKLTSIRTNEQSYSFEETKNRLLDYASASELKLEVREIRIGDLMDETEGSKEHEFLAFNCMVGLPHMGRTRNRCQVIDFVRVAKKILLMREGIITFGDGEEVEGTKHCEHYSSFFDKYLKHYHALCESMERNFPDNLREARIAMESLFVAPYVSPLSWHQKWESFREDCEFKENLGLMGWRLSKESVIEAKEMVKEGQNSYKIKVEGKNGNEMVLEWRGTPLVRVYAWR